MSSRSMLVGFAIVGTLTGCSSAPSSTSAVDREDAAVRVDLGSGSPDALARRAAAELADSIYIASRATRASPNDARIVVHFARPVPRGTGTQPLFETMVENALVATGRFLLVEDPAAPVIRSGVAGPLGTETLWVLVRGPGGDLWMEVLGRTDA